MPVTATLLKAEDSAGPGSPAQKMMSTAHWMSASVDLEGGKCAELDFKNCDMFKNILFNL